jgi:dipeptidase E
MGFLEHATGAIRAVLGDRGSLLFVPFASSEPDAYTSVMRQALAPADIEVTSLHQAGDPTAAVADAQAVFVGGGNSFRLLRTLTTLGVLEALRQAARAGVPYLGASAGRRRRLGGFRVGGLVGASRHRPRLARYRGKPKCLTRSG